ncbi:MAG: hypothetical protein AAFN92_18305, partial [Bacteroidota bacterium]
MRVITTLADKDYFFGFSALLNSIVAHGNNTDKIIVGYRNDLPTWLPQLIPFAFGHFFVSPAGIRVEFIPLEGEKHVVHE